MVSKAITRKFIQSLLVLGLVFAISSLARSHWQWLAEICGFTTGSGCVHADEYTLLRLPLAVWGIGFYLLGLGLLRWRPELLLYWIMPGAGVEVSLVVVMAGQGFVCFFCLLNAIVVSLLVLMHLKSRFIWASLALCLAGYILASFLLALENPGLAIRGDFAGGKAKAFSQVSVDDSPSVGPVDAEVIVIEFFDYRCPMCRVTHAAIREIMPLYPKEVRWIFKDFPSSAHRGAESLAEGACCANEQGRYWEFHSALFKSRELIDRAALPQLAASLGLNRDEFQKCLEEKRYARQIMENTVRARRAGISETPSFIINGRFYAGAMSSDYLKKLINNALAED